MFTFLKKAILKIIYLFKTYYRRIFYKPYFKRQMKKYHDACLVYFPEEGIGDLCIAMANLNSFKEKINKKTILFLCDLNIIKSVSSLYDYLGEIEFIKVKKMNAIARALAHGKYWRWYEKYHGANKLIIVSPWAYVSAGMLYYRKLDCLSLLADTAYRLEGKCKIEFPNLKANEIPATENKKILFNLFSNSMAAPIEIFLPIAEYFKSLGYEIYTNCKDEKSYCLSGTKPYICTIIELYQNAKQFEYIVSIRSGILDFLASSGVKQIVFYNGINFANLYSMKMWGCVNALELMCEDEFAMQKIKAFVEGGSES